LTALDFLALKIWPDGYPIKIAGPDIGKAQLPVHIVNGENDRPYVDSADRLAAALCNATQNNCRLPQQIISVQCLISALSRRQWGVSQRYTSN